MRKESHITNNVSEITSKKKLFEVPVEKKTEHRKYFIVEKSVNCIKGEIISVRLKHTHTPKKIKN